MCPSSLRSGDIAGLKCLGTTSRLIMFDMRLLRGRIQHAARLVRPRLRALAAEARLFGLTPACPPLSNEGASPRGDPCQKSFLLCRQDARDDTTEGNRAARSSWGSRDVCQPGGAQQQFV